MIELSLADARRIVLAAQGFTTERPARPNTASLRTLVDRLGAVQMDSVNVLVRAHYMPAFSRLGPYAREGLDRLVYRDRHLFEGAGHQASLLPVDLHPLVRWRMENPHPYWVAWAKRNARLVSDVERQVAERGPLAASELAKPGERGGPWWGWSAGKTALEYLFNRGRLAAADRRNFERIYDLTERVIPSEVLARPSPPVEVARRTLVERAARALGVATVRDLADYFVQKPAVVRPLVAQLVEDGVLHPARVEGWNDDAYVHPAVRPHPADGIAALVSPFDSLVWYRDRVQRLFGFHYRIEIYVPKGKRVHGYYVLPFLLGDRLVARVDLKADRAGRALLVQGAHAEAGESAQRVARALRPELSRLAGWLGLERVVSKGRGDLARALARGRRAGFPPPAGEGKGRPP